MKSNQYDTILIHCGELTLKGGNRRYFEKKLIENIKDHLRGLPYKSINNLYGRMTVQGVAKEDEAKLKERLLHVFGIANFAFAKTLKYAKEKTNVHEFINNDVSAIAVELLKERRPESFKIETVRSDKKFPLTSPEVSKEVGANVVQALNLKVDVKNPAATCFIEITDNGTYIYLDKIANLGGLPAGTSGKMIGFLSGGIDSPVACYKMMNRGAEIIFVHFHSYPQTSKRSIEKVRELAKILNGYQLNSKLYLIPFLDIQKQILIECRADLRVILYRRLMMRIGAEIAKTEKASAIITGESLGQVASQTIENLTVVQEVSDLPVLRPLIGADKNEIINIAKKINTFNTSIEPHEDCCSLFVPKHPATRARLEEVVKEEQKLDVDKLVKEATEKSEVINLS